ncbi:RNA polymerase recycling motor HelD [Listeria costaricensis]|uniref:RNA polymerase recycling motor HelD n=1 Tax=Listeria costaricensis TaxID=2026604 RepID=UPI000C08575A|nr:RNA polymerase recycling motor HelD [Listeria costaricensis]
MEETQEWQNEQARVERTLQQVEREEARLKTSVESVKGEASTIRENFWEDVRVNLSEPDDVEETTISIRQQEMFLRERERSYQHSEKQLAVFDKMKNSPYFARIDVEDEEGECEQVYIGISSLLDEEDQFLIYDWRAPISSVYYDGQKGLSTYQTPDGKLTVDVSLKRQFLIKKAIIQAMFDTNEAIGDEMLQEVLGSGSNVQMKNIVATIQQEQNQIIRDTRSALLFVQGAAGSGKTSAVLQRIAYLLYRFREGVDETQMIIFSPNRLFNHYISNVLPELGEKNMVQSTFQDFVDSRLGDLRVESLFEQFENKASTGQLGIRRLKEQQVLFEQLPIYLKKVQKQLQFKDIRFRGEVLISKERIRRLFDEQPDHLKLPEKMKALSKALREELYVIAQSEAKKDWVTDAVELLSEEEYRALVPGHLEFQGFDEEADYLAKKMIRLKFRRLHKRIDRYGFFHQKQQFVHFMQSVPQLIDLADHGITEAEWRQEVKQLVERLNKKQLSQEDAVFYLELQDQILGKHPNRAMRFVFIDEIQDYTPAQILYIQSIFPSSRFTMLGDLNQAIFQADDRKGGLLAEMLALFQAEKTKLIELKKSYRSTYEITEFTRAIIQDQDRIVPFERHGELPQMVQSASYVQMMDQILEKAEELRQKSGMVAIIGKDQEACGNCYLSLYKKMDVKLIHLENQKLADGVMIIPSYLAKGLEFDSVIVLDASDETYHSENERTLVYTICSRAMHRLVVTANGAFSRLFGQVEKERFEAVGEEIIVHEG